MMGHAVTQPIQRVMLLVHSPLVGPSTWRPAARRLVRMTGIAEVRVPDLTAISGAGPPYWESFVEHALASVSDVEENVVVVGHSGAGVYLPLIAHRLGNRFGCLLFVDAPVPPRNGVHRTAAEMMTLLDEQTEGGILRKWWDWWPADALSAAIPDPGLQETLRAEMPRVPRALYDEAVPIPDGWTDWPCAYIKLSAAYDADAYEAMQRGWPSIAVDGHHLTLVTEPDRVIDGITSMIGALSPAG